MLMAHWVSPLQLLLLSYPGYFDLKDVITSGNSAVLQMPSFLPLGAFIHY